MRVWVKDREIPGLAMSRSLGDYLAHTVGVTHQPVIEHFELTPNDQICIIASDGIFEFMSNQNVANIAMAHFESGQAEAAANAIVRRATQLWREKEEVVDDITCVVIFFERKLILKNLYSRQDLKKIEEADQKSRQEINLEFESTTNNEEQKSSEA